MPTQVSGARFLAANRRALLADAPRVGKTGAAIIAADACFHHHIDVVTTASGRAVWQKAFADWSTVGRTVGIVGVDRYAHEADVRVVSWGGVINMPKRLSTTLVISDEDHKAKNPDAACTQALYGKIYANGEQLLNQNAIVSPPVSCWHLTGTPLPHDPGDTWMRLRASAPERLLANAALGWPDVTRYDAFRERYCVIRMKKISNWNKIPVVIGGRNEDELSRRMEGFMLRRTQKDIGIIPPRYDTLPLIVSETNRRLAFADVDQVRILDAAIAGNTKELDLQLGPLKRLTGVIKARAVVEAITDELNDGGCDKIVVMYWHTEVGDILESSLAKFKPLRLDGSSSAAARRQAENDFRDKPEHRVFIGQIVAAGEAIDLSAAAVLWFVETGSPKDMAQAALRITNVSQTKNPVVKVCTIAGTIDDALQNALLRLWTSINKVIKTEKEAC
jgi:hypothetical protein